MKHGRLTNALTSFGCLVICLTGGTGLLISIQTRAVAEPVQVRGLLQCGAYPADPDRFPSFDKVVIFTVAQDKLTGERTLPRRRGKELYRGSIAHDGSIKVVGKGAGPNANFRSDFSGQFNDSGDTVLKGQLVGRRGHRECSISFMEAAEQLGTEFGLVTANGQPSQSSKLSGPSSPEAQETPKETPPPSIAAEKAISPRPLTDDLAPENRVPAIMVCSALSTDQKGWPEYSDRVDVQISQNLLTVERITKERPGRERLTGAVTKNGAIKLAGDGQYDDGGAPWTIALDGRLNRDPTKETVLTGTFRTNYGRGKGTRHCQLAISMPTSELRNRLSKMFDLEQRQEVLEQQQNETAEKTDVAISVLSNIILPVTETPSDWMLRVSAVPIQQQQFCRIVDRFYGDLSAVYLTHNDLRKNALVRDRQKDLAALLPGGRFENWVVTIKEVRQIDGGAAILLQPPCRAMLGSDVCQKESSNITTIIPLNSPIARELENVGDGDFVVISGKMLYPAQGSADDAGPVRAVYEPGTYCLSAAGAKTEDVFVSEITYLARLK